MFTYEAAIRETEKVGKRMPTDEEFDLLIKSKKIYYSIRHTHQKRIQKSQSKLEVLTREQPLLPQRTL